jgi:branched-chain amino acid transport system ATP-binding protein
MLKIKNLYAGYTKGNAILKGIHLNIKNDEVVGILGRNGSGKSTLAKSICGMVPNIDGDILLNGDSIIGLSSYEIAKKGIGFFQQGGRVFQNLSIEENLYFAIGAINSSERRERINELSNLFELLKKSDRLKLKASYLSGGEKHQLSLAMILIQKPKFLILDEPSAGLSPSNAVSLYEALFSNKRNTTTLLIEQNVPIAKQYCQKLIKMEELHQLQ